jgi:hypothetical protein
MKIKVITTSSTLKQKNGIQSKNILKRHNDKLDVEHNC